MSLTLEQYAHAKKLDIERLREWGLADHADKRGAYVRVPYVDEAGAEIAVRQRFELEGPNRFRWRATDKPGLYGLDRLAAARAQGCVVIVEGESDCHTLWQAGIAALGLPGAGHWRDARDASALEGFEKIYVVDEGDTGGDTIRAWLATSSIRDRAHVLEFERPLKDPSALYLADPENFAAAWAQKCETAIPWPALEAERRAKEEAATYEIAAPLARERDILQAFRANLKAAGLVGEDRNASVIYLALTSRLLKKPVSVAYKGPSSGGKSFAIDRVLAHFPDDATVPITLMSDKALIFTEEELKHRHLVIAEADGAAGEQQEYLIRSLLSEGRLEYHTAEKTPEGIVGRHIVKEGPTGLILTTTRVKLHPENETRMISLTANDTREQTRAVLGAVARRDEAQEDVAPEWPALQTWLTHGERRVAVPFAERLAGLVSSEAVRMRRDFGAVLSLIEAHALLHRATRERDAKGRIVATLDDYAAVRELVVDVIAEGVAAVVSRALRETVDIVAALAGESPALVADIAVRLDIDKSSAARRCLAARMAGYLVNEETMRGREARYRLGAKMPADTPVLPTLEALSNGEDRGGGVAPRGRVDRAAAPPPARTDATGNGMDRDPPPAASQPRWTMTL